jgi:hypothetical protein
MYSREQVSQFLLWKFPKLMTPGRQRNSAALWALVIHWCFRCRETCEWAADWFNDVRLPGEKRVTAAGIRKAVERIERARAAQVKENKSC